MPFTATNTRKVMLRQKTKLIKYMTKCKGGFFVFVANQINSLQFIGQNPHLCNVSICDWWQLDIIELNFFAAKLRRKKPIQLWLWIIGSCAIVLILINLALLYILIKSKHLVGVILSIKLLNNVQGVGKTGCGGARKRQHQRCCPENRRDRVAARTRWKFPRPRSAWRWFTRWCWRKARCRICRWRAPRRTHRNRRLFEQYIFPC